MTPDVAIQWLAWVGGCPVHEVKQLGLDAHQLVQIGQMLASNRLLNPPAPRRVKVGWFVCRCGCGQWFQAEYVTRHPWYVNNTHKVRAARARMRASAGSARSANVNGR